MNVIIYYQPLHIDYRVKVMFNQKDTIYTTVQ